MQFSKYLMAAALCATAAQAQAGAWTQDKGKGLLVVNGFYYAADEFYNNSGNKVSQSDYTKYELNPYAEYGLMDGITVGTNLSLQRAHQDSTPDQTNWGIGDSEFFVRARVMQQNGFVLSVEPMIKLPSPEESSETPRLGGSHPDAGLGLSAGYGFSAWGQNHFIDIDGGYRWRFGDPKDQLRFAGTLGLSANANWMIMPQVFATCRTSSPSVATFTQSSADDYNLVKLQLSAVYKMNEATSLQFGGFSHVDGKNTGAGDGGMISIWQRF